MLKQETAAKLRTFVEQGGTLISEGLPGYFGDHGHVGAVQPNYGLDEVFGARETYVEFTPDISNDLTLEVKGSKIYGRFFRQDYELSGGNAVGHYANGNIAAVEHTVGRGRTLLIGSFPGAGYYHHHAAPTRDLFATLVTPRLTIDDKTVQARLHQGPGGTYIWVTNQTRNSRTVKIGLADSYKSGKDLWGNQNIAVEGKQLTVTVGGRDAAVIDLL
jgi:beta-galactosidase